jgi:hypothetical protein
VHAFDGEMLKFIGGRLLAIFPLTGMPAASEHEVHVWSSLSALVSR